MRWGGFLALYLGLTGAIGLVQQSVISEREWSLGASSTISALMAMAWAWQPRSRVECFWLWFGRARVVEWPVWGICLLFLGCDALFAWLQGWRLSTPMLHATG